METLQGRALVASPYLTDPNFMRSVVYMLRHDDEGAIGLIVNRPTRTTVGAVLGLDAPLAMDPPVYRGGPVDGPLMVLEELRALDGTTSIAIASDEARIVELCYPSSSDPADRDRCRVFDGYSGWGAGQLEEGLRVGGWLAWDIQPDELFGDCDGLWQLAVRRIGLEILAGGIDPTRIPEDPAYN